MEEVKSFYFHLAIYLIFVTLFIYLNTISTSFPWAIFPIVGWGLGVLGHAACAFGWNPLFSKQWEARKIQEFMDKELQ